MTSTDTPLHARHQHDHRSPSEEIEHVASEAAFAARGTLSAVDVTAVVLIGLLVCPPLMILVVVVVVPLLVIALVLGLVAAVLSVPYLLVHRLRGHHGGHASLLADRLRRAGRALHDLAPHRIVADARRIHSGR
jgi:ABC-type nickel/cobalt efflux system permease component RcnA